ncbi:Collagen alpha-1(VII) chain like [Melia azedarach]|uniref:Collagen alpha-1(VII) chain like n=1 Tax=Melia azedarach TaxID=155640 RepID=A0ACC1XG30_MELAZ|nr:Collagen alpha-1(VII) chain like [Melia azedarach]
MLAQLRKTYDIPSSVKLSLPRPGFRSSRPESNEVVIHRQSFEYGLRLPIQPFFAQILSELGVAPAQLNSMAWRNLAELYILWKEVLGVEPTIEDVHAIFALTKALKKPGLYYLRTQWSRMGRRMLFLTNSRKWTCDLSRDTDLKSVREYVPTNPSETDIITEERLAKVGLIPQPSLESEVSTPSSATRRMAEGNKTDLAFLQLVRNRMAKAVGTPSQRAATGSGKSVVTSSGLPPRPKPAKKVEGPGWKPQLAVDLGGVLGGHFAHTSQLSRLTQKVKDKDDQILKLEHQLGEVRDEVGSVKTQLRTQVDRANELQASADKLETEAGSNLLHGYHYAQYQVTREFPDLDLHYMDFGFDRVALVAKFGKEQNPADVVGSSRQLTSGHPLNLEVSPPHSDQEEDDLDDEGSQSGKGDDT